MNSYRAELKIELFVRNTDVIEDSNQVVEEIKERKDHLVCKLDEMEEKGLIAELKVFEKAPKMVSSSYRNSTNGYQKNAIERFDEYDQWATRHGFNLKPFFDERPISPRAEDSVFFPDLYLAAYEGYKLQGLFPCSDGEKEYSIEHYLNSLELGKDWEKYNSTSKLQVPDYGAHGAIKAHLKENLQSVVGEKWVEAKDEFPVFAEKYGRIDLLCRTKDRNEYLLIEVKPKKDKDELDKAFGQILRYKHQFIADKNIPDLNPEQVTLAIAAPSFYDFHQEAADEIGVRLIKVG